MLPLSPRYPKSDQGSEKIGKPGHLLETANFAHYDEAAYQAFAVEL